MKKRFTAGVLLAIFYVFIFRDRIFICEHNGYAFEFAAGSECAGNCAGCQRHWFCFICSISQDKICFCKKRVVTVMFPLIMAVCLFFLYEADSYAICLLQAVLYLCCLDCLAVLCIIMHFFMLAEIRTWHF